MINKLRQLENQQLPDLSQMDQHWKELQLQLAVPVTKAAVKSAYYWLAAASVAVVLAFVWILNRGKEPVKTAMPAVAEQAPRATTVPAPPAVLPEPVTKPVSRPAEAIATGVTEFVPQNEIITTVPDSIAATAYNIPVADTPTGKKIMADNQAVLQNLLASVEQPPQVFFIDNKKDTVLVAREGTVVFLPAGSFATNDSIRFEIREFYSYAEMVANGLSTLSDGRQLVTGGMLHLVAKRKGQETAINPQRPLRVFIPGITAADSMQIFSGKKGGSGQVDYTNAQPEWTGGDLNWELTKVSIDSPVYKMFIRALDLRDDAIEYTTYHGGEKVKAVFRRSPESPYSKEELMVMLKKKYGDYYDKIKIRSIWKRDLLFRKRSVNDDEEYYRVVYNSSGIGDTSVFLPGTVRIYRLTPIDTVYRVCYWAHLGYREMKVPVFSRAIVSAIGEKYSIALDKLGWINCDRFYQSNQPKTDYAVDVSDDANNYVAYMVFDKIKSVLGSSRAGNRLIFTNIPASEPVRIMVMGARNGKPVSALINTNTSRNLLDIPVFEAAAADDIRSSLDQLNR